MLGKRSTLVLATGPIDDSRVHVLVRKTRLGEQRLERLLPSQRLMGSSLLYVLPENSAIGFFSHCTEESQDTPTHAHHDSHVTDMPPTPVTGHQDAPRKRALT